MLILSQDKTRIVNFKNKEDIFLKEDYYEGKFLGTKIIAIGKIDSLLGKYNTEERAKEVLKEIITANSNFSYFKNATEEGKNYIINLLKHKYEQFDIFQMPKE